MTIAALDAASPASGAPELDWIVLYWLFCFQREREAYRFSYSPITASAGRMTPRISNGARFLGFQIRDDFFVSRFLYSEGLDGMGRA